MEQKNIEDIILKLNSISHMALIENADATQKMLIAMIRLLRHRWQPQNSKVLASMELKLADMICSYYALKSNHNLTYQIQESDELHMVFVPHYTILGWYDSILNTINNEYDNARLVLTTELVKQEHFHEIHIVMKGNLDFQKVYQMANDFQYDPFISLEQITIRFEEEFGMNTIAVNISNYEYMEVILRVN